MTPGPTLEINCPACGQTHFRGSINSGNTFGARYYSDGKRIAPMLPEFPYFVKCQSADCGVFFKANKTKPCADKNSKGDFVRFLSINEYIRAIDVGLFNSAEKGSDEWNDDILSLRIELWRAFNHRDPKMSKITLEDKSVTVLDGLEKATSEEKAVYVDNCRKITSLMENKSDDVSCLIKAENYRNIGEFDMCKRLLRDIKEPEKYKAAILTIDTACDVNTTFTALLEHVD